jgi:hypothetical protein
MKTNFLERNVLSETDDIDVDEKLKKFNLEAGLQQEIEDARGDYKKEIEVTKKYLKTNFEHLIFDGENILIWRLHDKH